MRRIWTSTDKGLIDHLCKELSNHDIPYSVDTEKDLDWGSENYGSLFFSVWTHDDADVERAKAVLSQLPLENPPVHTPIVPAHTLVQQYLQEKLRMSLDDRPVRKKHSRLATIAFFILCSALFVIGHREREQSDATGFSSPYVTSGVYELLLFDYPAARVLENELIGKYGPQSIDPNVKLTEEGRALRTKLMDTPYWGGVYTFAEDKLAQHFDIPRPSLSPSLMFERIREGQVWRLLSPCFLHGDIFHLIFNMLWLVFLGSQIERHIGMARFLFFFAFVGILSNTAQYLMSGPYFLGISGVICGMAGFIIERQRQTPWEGYRFSEGVYSALLFFIWALVALAGAAFFIESYINIRFPISFANTAHLVGLAAGLLLGKSAWFRAKETAFGH